MDCLNQVFFYNLGKQDQSLQEGYRPVLILKDTGEFLLVAPLTTRRKHNLPTHVSVQVKDKPSTVLLEQLFWIRKPDMTRKVLYHLENETASLQRVRNAMKIALGITPVNAEYELEAPCYRGQIYLTPEQEYLVVIQNNVGNQHSTCTIVGVLVSGRLNAIRTINTSDFSKYQIAGRKRHVTQEVADFLGI